MTLVEYLADPCTYPEKPAQIKLVQTHASWVFIGDEFCYKLKKPVNLGFLDFSTLEKRGFYVHEELRLNRRFSPQVYLEALPISEQDGRFRLGDATHVVDYVLKMRRVDESRMLAGLLGHGDVMTADMQRLGRHIARIYQAIPSDAKAQTFGTVDCVAFNAIENFEEIRPYIGGPVSRDHFDAIEGWSLAFLQERAALFDQRVAAGCIKEGHGDLHLQHIYLAPHEIIIIDCIEFNERFRYGDVAQDVAFLAMDLEYNGHPLLACVFTEAFCETCGDATLPEILPYYKVYRALVRAKVHSFLLDDPGIEPQGKAAARDRARSYYDLAWGYVQ